MVLKINKLNTFRAVGGVLEGPKDDLERRKILVSFFVVRNDFLELQNATISKIVMRSFQKPRICPEGSHRRDRIGSASNSRND